jgi:hypothetical protein
MVATKTKAQSGSRRRASASSPISKDALEQAQLSLTGLPEKPKAGVALREAVEQMQDAIVGALAKGYSHEDVASLLTEKGVEINAPSLKYYLSRLKKTKRRKVTTGTTGRRGRAKASAEATESSNESVAAEAPAKKTTRGKATGQTASRRAAAKSKSTAAEASVAVEPTSTSKSSKDAEPSTKKQSTRGATTTKAPTKSAPRSQAAPKTPSSRSRKK